MERDWYKTTQVRHILILDVPSDEWPPGRGDIEAGWLFGGDQTREDVITLHRDAEVDYDTDPPEVRPKGKWRRDDAVWGPKTQEEEYELRQRMIKTMKETIRFLQSDMPQLKEKITGYTQTRQEEK